MKRSVYTILLLILCAIYIICYNANINVSRDDITLMGYLGLLQFGISMFSWISSGKKIISPYFIFLAVLYIFSFGQSLLYPFDIISERRDLYDAYGFSANNLFLSQIQTLLMLNVFHIAGLKYSRQRLKCNLKSDTNAKSFNQLNRLKSVGWSLFFISVIPYAIDTISDMILSINYGYGSLYQQTAKVGFANATSLIAAFFIPSVICLFIVYREHKKIRIFFTTIILLIVLATLIIGGRSNAVILLSLLIILYEYLVRPFSKKFIFLGVVAGFFFLQVLTYVAAVRSTDDRSSIAPMIEMSNNPAAEAIIEMGWSQFCLVESMRIVPEIEDYRYGKSYLYAFTSIIPNMGFWPIHPAMIESNLGDWLTDTLGLNFGTGFSMCAEAWVNFGSWGFIIFYIWGAILGSLLGRIESTISTGNVAFLAFLLIVFWFSLKIPRNSFLNLVRAVFYYAGPIFLYCNNYKLRGK